MTKKYQKITKRQKKIYYSKAKKPKKPIKNTKRTKKSQAKKVKKVIAKRRLNN